MVVFVILALLGVTFVGAKYVRLNQLVGFGYYTVHAELPQTGGLFPNAMVSYRGVPVGRVGDIDLAADGVVAQLRIDSGTPKIPASTKAVVANMAAIGEQYIDLQPDNDASPYLSDGSTIKTGSVPLSVTDLLASAESFAGSIPLDDLHTTVAELGRAFNGHGDDLKTVVDSLNEFTEEWQASLPQTIALIRDSRIVLETQAAQAGSIRTFANGLDELSAQLRASDQDLRRLIGAGPPFAHSVDQLLIDSGPALTTDLTNLRVALAAISPKAWAVKPLLQGLPILSLGPSSTAPGDGTTHFGLVLETNNPPPCTQGYEGTKAILAAMKARNPDFDDTRDEFPFNANARCTVPQGNPTDVRGGARAELADPALRQPWDSTPKTMPDTLNLQPLASQLAPLLGVTTK